MKLLLFCVAVSVGSILSLESKVFENPNKDKEQDNSFWIENGRNEIKEALSRPVLNHAAKNIILFVGDGMGITVNTAGRIYSGQKNGDSGEENSLVWENFPNIGLIKTYNVDKQVPDSAATATAFLTGVKTNFYTVGVNSRVKLDDCQASLDEENRLISIVEYAQKAGKDTGVVTTAGITHATPAATYAHSANRDWVCDSALEDDSECKDIARQLIEDEPGKNLNVILGGGRLQMGATKPGDDELSYLNLYPSCNRSDGRNLAEEWMEQKKNAGKNFEYVTTGSELEDVDAENTEFIMGLFGAYHMPYDHFRKRDSLDIPSLKQMTEVAIKRLSTNKENGYFLMVEGGRIDHGLHASRAHLALDELVAMNDAVAAALKMVNLNETLVVVTADHSHTLSFSGYPERGNDILGLVTNNKNVVDGSPYTTLNFANGEGAQYSYDAVKKVVQRGNLSEIDTTDVDFLFPSGVKSTSETHGGEDVAVFATGPMSHLFHKVHEQTYIAHVMGYAACLGPFEDDCVSQKQKRDVSPKMIKK